MARIETHPKVILTQEERMLLRRVQSLVNELDAEDKNGDIFSQCDNSDCEWGWVDSFIETLVNISEVE